VEAVRANPDAALLLLDVVMEHEHAASMRSSAFGPSSGNRKLRIVLRNRASGMAPESEVIARYDINGYAEKTELTRANWRRSSIPRFAPFATSRRSSPRCRSSRPTGAASSRSSMRPRRSSSCRASRNSPPACSTLGALLPSGSTRGLYARMPGVAAVSRTGDFTVVAGTGPFEAHIDRSLAGFAAPDVFPDHELREAGGPGRAGRNISACFRASSAPRRSSISRVGVTGVDHTLIELFQPHIGHRLRHIELREVIEKPRRDRSTASAARSNPARRRPRATSSGSPHLELLASTGACRAERIVLARLADARPRKIGIPDNILKQPAKLTTREWKVMRTPSVIGPGASMISPSRSSALADHGMPCASPSIPRYSAWRACQMLSGMRSCRGRDRRGEPEQFGLALGHAPVERSSFEMVATA